MAQIEIEDKFYIKNDVMFEPNIQLFYANRSLICSMHKVLDIHLANQKILENRNRDSKLKINKFKLCILGFKINKIQKGNYVCWSTSNNLFNATDFTLIIDFYSSKPLLFSTPSCCPQACHLLSFLSKELLGDFEACAEMFVPVRMFSCLIKIVVNIVALDCHNILNTMLRYFCSNLTVASKF